jgi:hypothetical protein
MDIRHLQDRVYWGLNRVASVLGESTDAYRPKGASDPLDRSNRFMRLQAAFSRVDGNFDQPIGYGVPVCRGYFDASYTRVGDYLVQGSAIWFIAEQESMLPVMCVRTNRIITVTRLLGPDTKVSSDPSNVTATINVITRWPASVLGTGTEGRSQAQLPGDTRIPSWTTLLPSIEDQTLQPADIILDENGTTGVVVAAEISNLGWRLNVRQVTT